MGYHIFYSYQSDIKKKLKQEFIRDAINNAISRINEFQIEPLIEGFYGVSGNPPLAEKMLQQSEKSDMFIGDVTFTSSKVWHNPIDFTEDEKSYFFEIPKGDLKPSPNPNVLIETGYSWALKKYERTILVMNTAFGDPSRLPVDMGDKRHPITYNLSEAQFNKPSIYKKEFESLSDALLEAIKQVIISESEYQREKWKPFKLYKYWKSEDFNDPYIPIPELKDRIIKLRNALKNAGNPQRIVGPKNSGKTRLAREMFQEIDTEILKDDAIEKVLYYNLEVTEYSSIERQVLDLATTNQDQVVIVDNCSCRTHKRICKDLLETKVRLLTIYEGCTTVL